EVVLEFLRSERDGEIGAVDIRDDYAESQKSYQEPAAHPVSIDRYVSIYNGSGHSAGIQAMTRTGLTFLFLVCVGLAFGQGPLDHNTPIVRITTSSVQIDAVVTDKHGEPVTDLTKNDFQILQDGKPRDITGFSFVSVSPKAEKLAAPKPGRDKLAPP